MQGALGGWRFGNTINGAWAEYLLVPDARANLALIPDGLTDEQVLLLPDIFSTGLSGAESGNIRVGDSVAVFAQGPIGLCATLGARLRGAALIIGVDPIAGRREMARRFGANVTLDPTAHDVVAEIKRLTDGRGVDVAIEALGRQETFEIALRATPAGRHALEPRRLLRASCVAPYEALYAGLGDQRIVTTLCPGRQGADAAADGDGGERAASTSRRSSRTSSRSTTAARGVRPVQPPGAGVLKVGIFPGGVPDEGVATELASVRA